MIREKGIFFRISALYKEGMSARELYETTRGVWRIGKRREKAEYAFCVYKNEIIEVYRILQWYPAGTLPYDTRSRESVDIEGRWEFEGEVADSKVRSQYIGRSVEDYISKGAINPVIYVNC